MTPRSWREPRAGVGAAVLAILVALLAVVAVPTGAGTLRAAAPPGSGVAVPTGAAELAAAEASLARGEGPGAGHSVSCSGSTGAGPRCDFAPAASGSGASSLSWVPLDPGPASRVPFARAYAPLVWDASDGYVLLFGGGSEGFSNYVTADTWIFSDGHWTMVPTATAPSPRDAEALVYDPSLGGGEVLLFGGYQYVNGTSFNANDTWTYHAGIWTNVTVPGAAAPPAIWGMGATYDAADGYVLLYGGIDDGYVALNVTWSYTSAGWVNRTNSVTPGPRFNLGMAYDPAASAVILFGGLNSLIVDAVGTWQYAAGVWSPVSVTNGPSGREGPAFAYSASLSAMVLYGGENDSSEQFQSDTWTFAAGVWTNVTVPGPGPLAWVSMVAEGPSGGLVLFGGFNSTTGQDSATTWTYASGAWTEVTPDLRSPPGTSGAEMTYDAVDGYVVLFGGYNGTGDASNQTWTFASNWTQLNLSVAPPAAQFPSLAFDAAEGYVLLFGGETFDSVGNPGFSDQTWSFVHGVWTNRTATSGTPPLARYGASATYDPLDSEVLLYGGYGYDPVGMSYLYFADTWAFGGGTWSQLPTSGAPPGREGAVFVFDLALNESVLFGGYNGSAGGELGDTWLLAGSEWDEPYLTETPSARVFAAGAYDPVTSSVVVAGGQLTNTLEANDTWSFSAAGWTLLERVGSNGYRTESAAVFDPRDGLALVFGGLSESDFLGDTWALDALHVNASASPLAGVAPLSVSFKGNATLGVPGYRYLWNFGDGTSSNLSNGTHVFSGGGNYTVDLTVTDAAGAAASTTLLVSVRAPLYAEATASTTVGPAPLTVDFAASATGGTAPYTFAWHFGDGATSGAPSPSHTYTTPGSYSVLAWVNDSAHASVLRELNLSVTSASPGGGGGGGAGTTGTGFSLVWLAVGLIVGAMAGAVVGILIRGRRGGGSTGSSPPGGASPPNPPGPPPGASG